MFEMVMGRVAAIACGHGGAIDLDRLRHDPLMKVVVGRCPITSAPLASQSTISRLENAPSKTEAAWLTAALVDQAGTAVKSGRREILDIDERSVRRVAVSSLRSRTRITTSTASRQCTSNLAGATATTAGSRPWTGAAADALLRRSGHCHDSAHRG
jgi:hypothetical protein